MANLGGDAVSDCTVRTVEELHKMGKMIAIHVSDPFYFQCQSIKDKSSYSIDRLKKYTNNISIGNN